MKTYLLKWDPAISSFSMDNMRWEIEDAMDILNTDFNWSVYDWQNAKKGDRVFMLRVGDGKTGIMASGFLKSDPYEDKDWRGSDQIRHYSDVIFDIMLFPVVEKILETTKLQKEIPSIDWVGGHSGVMISQNESEKLEELWSSFLKENGYFSILAKSDTFFQSLRIRAWGIAFNAHKGQVDKAGKDYFEAHIMDVYEKVCRIYDEDENICLSEIVAILHDVVEDTDWTFERLKEQGFTDEILEALSCVTKQENEDYEHFVARSKSNPVAKAVKIADLKSNMDITRLNDITDEDVNRLRKYLKAYKFLTSED